MKIILLFFTLTLLLVTLGCTKSEQTIFKVHSSSVSSSEEPPVFDLNNENEIKPFFEVKCSICHSLNRSKSGGEKDYDDLLMTIYSMKNHYGAQITEEEVEIIAQYLAETYGKSTPPTTSELSCCEDPSPETQTHVEGCGCN